jgi:hypothetical protein
MALHKSRRTKTLNSGLIEGYNIKQSLEEKKNNQYDDQYTASDEFEDSFANVQKSYSRLNHLFSDEF